MNKKVLIVVVGPTAVGKTKVAIQLAKYFNTSIVSADARQVFKELNIGTAKPTARELGEVKHHFIDSHSIVDDFNANSFALQAEEIIKQKFGTSEFVILCGGSGLYIKALLHGFDEMPGIPKKIRETLTSEFQERGIEWLQNEVMIADPDYYNQADKFNSQRLMRALEVYRATGNPFSSFKIGQKKKLPFDVVKVGLNLDRQELYDRIDSRMDAMIQAGLFDEAQSLFANKNLNALQTVGYQEIFDFMGGKYAKEEAIRLLKRNSRRYAKRQLTWFGSDKEITWFHPEDYEKIVRFIQEKSAIL